MKYSINHVSYWNQHASIDRRKYSLVDVLWIDNGQYVYLYNCITDLWIFASIEYFYFHLFRIQDLLILKKKCRNWFQNNLLDNSGITLNILPVEVFYTYTHSYFPHCLQFEVEPVVEVGEIENLRTNTNIPKYPFLIGQNWVKVCNSRYMLTMQILTWMITKW